MGVWEYGCVGWLEGSRWIGFEETKRRGVEEMTNRLFNAPPAGSKPGAELGRDYFACVIIIVGVGTEGEKSSLCYW